LHFRYFCHAKSNNTVRLSVADVYLLKKTPVKHFLIENVTTDIHCLPLAETQQRVHLCHSAVALSTTLCCNANNVFYQALLQITLPSMNAATF